MKRFGRIPTWLAMVTGLAATVRAEPAIDESKLPSPASQKIDFRRDIEPILKDTCLRCHGPERPKSHFRLTDRASALKGGENGIDIIVGKSAKSPLIHYIARLVPDMEMPPEGKGKPLSANQVALLRAWIDQGFVWSAPTNGAGSPAEITVEPVVGGTIVRGDRGKFRELEGVPEGWNGGVEKFQYRQLSPDGHATTVEGHLLRDDYRFLLDARSPELGFARLGFQQFRRYYDDAGGYYGGFSPSLFHLGDDLHLDIGRVWTEVGLTLPNWPRIVLGYEYRYREGSKSMLSWGPAEAPGGNFLEARSIYPSSKFIAEHVHIVRLDLSYEGQSFRLEDNLRLEFYDSGTRRADALAVPAGAGLPSASILVREQHSYTQVGDGVSAQKEFADWWLGGLGYRYSWLEGDADLRLTPRDASGQPGAGSAWSSDRIVLREVWQVFNAYSQFRPIPNLTATPGVQAQWKRQDTFGDVNLDEVADPTDPTSGILRLPATEQSTLDQTSLEENMLLRYTGLPFTALYAEAKLEQEDYDRTADQQGTPRPAPHDFLLSSEAAVRWQDFRAGFSSSPWRKISFGGYYRHRDRRTDYDYPVAKHDGAYPGFIRARDIAVNEVSPRVVVRPIPSLTATFEYRYSVSEYHTTTGSTSPANWGADATPGGQIYAGRYDAHTASASLTLTPVPRLHLTAAISYQNSQTTTADHGSPSVAPYRGDLWSLVPTAVFALNRRTDLLASYLFNRVRYSQHNAAAGLPLGLDYDRHGIQLSLARRLSQVLTLRLQYGYFSYSEPSSGHLHDYTAHQLLAVARMVW